MTTWTSTTRVKIFVKQMLSNSEDLVSIRYLYIKQQKNISTLGSITELALIEATKPKALTVADRKSRNGGGKKHPPSVGIGRPTLMRQAKYTF